jgi:arylsulfatase A-like enzyme
VARVTNPSPPAARAEELRSQYLQGVRYLDVKLDDMLKGLNAAGLYDRSLIVVTADHGEEFNEHDGFWHGTTLYEEQIHVPLVIKKPGGHAERRTDRVRSIDIGPTVMALAGLRSPGTFQGVNVFDQRVEEPIIAEEELEGNRIVSILSGPWKLIKANPGNPRGLQTVELYNLESDPLEKNNLAASEPQRVSELEAMLRELMG